MDMMDLADQVEQAAVRFDFMVPVMLGLAAFDCAGDWLEEFVESLPEGADDPLYAALPCLKQFANDDQYPEEEEVIEALCMARPPGFLVRVAHPVMSYTKGYQGSSFSWGHYNTTWLYSETMEGLVEAAIGWASKLDDANMARVGVTRAEAYPLSSAG